MRLRNIPRADGVIQKHSMVIKVKEDTKGSWKEIFGNGNPIHIEIGMGKGQFLMGMAKANPDINYVGIERYTSVLLRAVEACDEGKNEKGASYENLRFLNVDATNIQEVFHPGEIQKIYLNFSDPWPKKRHAHRRLTSESFWKRYAYLLEKGQEVEFKTDNQELFQFSLEELEENEYFSLVEYTKDLHHHKTMCEGNIMTEYEAKFSAMGNPICKLIAKKD